jgi:hypothetical protein
MKLPKTQLMAVLLLSVTSLAIGAEGTDRGNGGDVVYCVDGSGKESAELLDIYEARTLRDISLDLGGKGVSIEEKEELLIARAAKVSLEAANDLKKKLASFMRESKFIENANLVDIPDSEHIVFPKNRDCSIRQVIIQQKVTFPEDRKYVVDSQLWRLLDVDNQLSLKTHEVIWEKALASGATHSRGVRYFNSYLFSGKIQALSWVKFYEFSKKTGVRYLPQISGVSMSSIEDNVTQAGDLFGYSARMAKKIEMNTRVGTFLVDELRFNLAERIESFSAGAAGELQRIEIPNGDPIEAKGTFSVSFTSDNWIMLMATTQGADEGHLHGMVRLKIRSGLDQSISVVSVPARSRYMSFQDGFLVNADVEGLNYENPVNLPIHGRMIPVTNLVRNYRNLLPERIQIPANYDLKMKIQDQELSIGPVESMLYSARGVTFYPTGQLSTAVLRQDARLVAVNGKKIRVPSGSIIQLGEDGRLHSYSIKGDVKQF